MAVRPGDEARRRVFRGIGSWSDRTIEEMGDWIFMAAPFALATLVGAAWFSDCFALAIHLSSTGVKLARLRGPPSVVLQNLYRNCRTPRVANPTGPGRF